MNAFELHYETLYQQMNAELIQVKVKSDGLKQEAEQCILIVRRYLQNIKTDLLQTSLMIEEEVMFFKKIKPLFYRHLIYYYKVLQIELGKPTAGKKALLKYLNWQLTKLAYFFKKYDYLFRYCRSGATSSDRVFFVRGNIDLLPGVAAYGVDTDPSFTTGYDFIVAKMNANELLQSYLENEIQKIRHPENMAANEPERSIS